MVALPPTYRAVVCHEYGQPLKLDTRPTPSAEPGSAVIQVLAAIVDPSEEHRLLKSKRNPYFSQETPFIPGNGAVGRIAAVGKDATSLQVGQLVLLEGFVRGRDDPNAQALRAVYEGPSPAAKRLTHTEGLWRDGYWAEYVRAPLESCWPLDESALLGPTGNGGLGYKISDLPYLIKHAVAYGGFRSIDLRPGQTVIITPATGNHGGAAVQVAAALGARVIAVGRNADTLRRLSESNPRVHGVNLTGDVAEDVKTLSQFGTIDAFMDFTPSSMAAPLHLKACVAAVKSYGRGVLMGFPHGDFALPYGMMVAKNISIRAQYMYEASDMRSLVQLAERGLLKLGGDSGVHVIDGYTLEQYDEAVAKAAEQQAWGRQVIFEPFKQ
jgi:D-arabinose 1-dehydrogenase-like Zn-dependent alcohol dehydrogenase